MSEFANSLHPRKPHANPTQTLCGKLTSYCTHPRMSRRRISWQEYGVTEAIQPKRLTSGAEPVTEQPPRFVEPEYPVDGDHASCLSRRR